MLRSVLIAKIHRARVTGANLEYEGSLAVDSDLLELSDIRPFERVSVSNLENGERFDTYVIPAEGGSGTICLNGPAARKGVVGDRIVIFCYGYVEQNEMGAFSPKIVRVDERNRPL